MGADCGHAHGLNAVFLHKLRLLLGVLLDHLQELDIQGVQELLCHLGLLPAEGGQGRQPLLGDGKGVELGAAHAGTDQVAALIQVLHGGAGGLGVHPQGVGQVGHVAVADAQHLQNLLFQLAQLDLLTVGGGGHPLPAGAAVILGLAEQGGDHRHHQGDHQAQGGQIHIAVDGEHLGQVQQGEHSHGGHAAHRAPQGAASVKAGPDGAQAQQNGGGHQPAVGKGEQVGGAAGELAEHEGDHADEQHDDLGHLQALLCVSLGVDQALVDITVGHSGGAQGGGGCGRDGCRHGADNHQGAKQRHEGLGHIAVGAGRSHGTAVEGELLGIERAHVAADEAQGHHEHHNQDDGSGHEGAAGHLLTAAVGDLHPVVVVAPNQGYGEADNEVKHRGVGQLHAGQRPHKALAHEVAGTPVGADGVQPAESSGQDEEGGGHHNHADEHLEQVGDGGGPQAGDKGKHDDDSEDNSGNGQAVPAGEGRNVVHTGHHVIGHNAAHADNGGDGHYGTGVPVVAHLQKLGQGLGAAAADKVGVQQAEDQQAAHRVDDTPTQAAQQAVLNREAGGQCDRGAGKADSNDAHHVDGGGNLTAGQHEVGGLLDPPLADQACAQ